MPTVARTLFGEPNPHHSKPDKPRWGNKGSLAINESRGVWYDHESKTGGGVLDLIGRERQLDRGAAIKWLGSIGCGVTEQKSPAVRIKRKAVALYNYHDVDGSTAIQVLRMAPVDSAGKFQPNAAGKLDKTFGQRRPVPGTILPIWIWGTHAGEYMSAGPGEDWKKFTERGWANLPATRQRQTFEAARVVPYHLPELVEAIAQNRTVFVVEGEQKANALADWNLVGTCNVSGAGKWTEAHAAHLKTADVVILPDNDDAGRKHAEAVAQSLVGIASRIRILELPGLDAKGDMVDWQKAGHTREEFDGLVAATTDWRPAENPPDVGGKSAKTDQLAVSAVIFESAAASTFKMTALTWLWPNRFALGKLGLLAGLPDRGKGLITADMAARVTNGDLWPCNEGRAIKGNIVVLSAEDDINDTIVPRLRAAGADLDRVHIARMIRQGEGKRMFNLVSDLELLRQKLDEIGDVVMVIIDPMSAYLGVGKVDSYRTTDVRGVLAPLTELAAEKRIFVLGVLHFNKKSDVNNAMLRIADSLAFTATARHCYVVVDDLENDRKLFVKAKNNLAPDTKALSYAVNAVVVGQDEETGKDIWAPRVVWGLEHVEITATEAMEAEAAGKSGANSALAAGETFLANLLANGAVSKREVEEAAAAHGISKATLRRAAKDLNVQPRKSGMKGGWTWQLPDPRRPNRAAD
jgi:hypothetical protein